MSWNHDVLIKGGSSLPVSSNLEIKIGWKVKSNKNKEVSSPKSGVFEP